MNMTIAKPRFRQAAIAMIDGHGERRVRPSQLGPLMPNAASAMLTRPESGSSTNRQTTAMATMLVTTGR